MEQAIISTLIITKNFAKSDIFENPHPKAIIQVITMKEVGQTTTIIEHIPVNVPGIPSGQGTPEVIKIIFEFIFRR